MMPGVDSSTVMALGAVAAGSMVVAPILSDDSDTATAASPAVAAPTMTPGVPVTFATANTTAATPIQGSTLEDFLARENVSAYQGRSCDYLHISLSDADKLIASSSDPIAPKVGQAKKSVVTQVMQGKNCPALSPLPGRIGAVIQTIDPVKAPKLKLPSTGVWVDAVSPGSNAQKAGLSRGDVVVAINNSPVDDSVELRLALGQSPIGSTVTLKVWHAQRFYDAPVLIGQ
ncbi:PDZ domain-containing protein [Pseudomonas sp. O230]|uniref:PDZ domain-containing protein n=1 Tax=Pseudomonas sp. O230 TaxID=3159450 RepID=UPI00387AEC23